MMQEPYIKRPLFGPVRLTPDTPQPYHSEESIFIRRRREKGQLGADGFSPLEITSDESTSTYTIKIEPSVVQEVIPQSGIDCVVNHDVYYGGVILTRDTEIPVPHGHTLVCRVNQDTSGGVKTGPLDGPTLIVEAMVPVSSHWYPADPLGPGSDGTMYFPLYKLDRLIDGGDDIVFYHWGPIVVRNDLWKGENLGVGAGVFKEHAEALGALYRFRSIHGRYALAHAETDDVILDFLGENLGTPTYGGGEVYKEQGGGNTDVKAGFRKLSGGPSGRQEITVAQNGDIIQIYGNGMDFTLTLDNCDGTYATLVWTDGLLSSAQDETPTDITSFTHYGECNETPAP